MHYLSSSWKEQSEYSWCSKACPTTCVYPSQTMGSIFQKKNALNKNQHDTVCLVFTLPQQNPLPPPPSPPKKMYNSSRSEKHAYVPLTKVQFQEICIFKKFCYKSCILISIITFACLNTCKHLKDVRHTSLRKDMGALQ